MHLSHPKSIALLFTTSIFLNLSLLRFCIASTFDYATRNGELQYNKIELVNSSNYDNLDDSAEANAADNLLNTNFDARRAHSFHTSATEPQSVAHVTHDTKSFNHRLPHTTSMHLSMTHHQPVEHAKHHESSTREGHQTLHLSNPYHFSTVKPSQQAYEHSHNHLTGHSIHQSHKSHPHGKHRNDIDHTYLAPIHQTHQNSLNHRTHSSIKLPYPTHQIHAPNTDGIIYHFGQSNHRQINSNNRNRRNIYNKPFSHIVPTAVSRITSKWPQLWVNRPNETAKQRRLRNKLETYAVKHEQTSIEALAEELDIPVDQVKRLHSEWQLNVQKNPKKWKKVPIETVKARLGNEVAEIHEADYNDDAMIDSAESSNSVSVVSSSAALAISALFGWLFLGVVALIFFVCWRHFKKKKDDKKDLDPSTAPSTDPSSGQTQPPAEGPKEGDQPADENQQQNAEPPADQEPKQEESKPEGDTPAAPPTGDSQDEAKPGPADDTPAADEPKGGDTDPQADAPKRDGGTPSGDAPSDETPKDEKPADSNAQKKVATDTSATSALRIAHNHPLHNNYRIPPSQIHQNLHLPVIPHLSMWERLKRKLGFETAETASADKIDIRNNEIELHNGDKISHEERSFDATEFSENREANQNTTAIVENPTFYLADDHGLLDQNGTEGIEETMVGDNNSTSVLNMTSLLSVDEMPTVHSLSENVEKIGEFLENENSFTGLDEDFATVNAVEVEHDSYENNEIEANVDRYHSTASVDTVSHSLSSSALALKRKLSGDLRSEIIAKKAYDMTPEACWDYADRAKVAAEELKLNERDVHKLVVWFVKKLRLISKLRNNKVEHEKRKELSKKAFNKLKQTHLERIAKSITVLARVFASTFYECAESIDPNVFNAHSKNQHKSFHLPQDPHHHK